MKSIKNLTTKKLLSLTVSFVLLVATLFGVLFGAKRSARAEIINGVVVYSQAILPERKITDSGMFDNTYDVFDCNKYFPNPLSYMNQGYKYVTVTLNFQMREISDGYQDIYLCPGASSSSLTSIKLDYYGNRKIDAYHDVGVYFKSLPLIDFVDKDYKMHLVIRYDAHGAGNDDWMYRFMYIMVELSKDELRNSNAKEGNV